MTSVIVSFIFLTLALAQQRSWPIIPLTEVSRFGGIEAGALSFVRLVDVAHGPNGTIYIAQQNTPHIVALGVESSRAWTFGQSGKGPGDFQAPASLGFVADTLWVADFGARRLTMFDDRHKATRIVTASDHGISRYFSGIRPVGFFADGKVLAVPVLNRAFISSGVVTSMPLYRLNSSGEVIDTLASVRIGNDLRVLYHPAGRGAGAAMFVQQLSDDPLWRLAGDGSGVFLLTRTIESGRRVHTFTITKVSAEGDTIFKKAFNYPALRVSERLADSLIQDAATTLLKSKFRSDLKDAKRDVRRAFFLPETFPAVLSMTAGTDGRLWVELASNDPRRRDWLALSGKGEVLGLIKLPVEQKVLESMNQHLWTAYYDEMGIGYLTHHRIGRRK